MASSSAPALEAEISSASSSRHAPVRAAAHVGFPARHVLAPGGMDAVEIGFDELRRLLVGVAAVLPQKRRDRRGSRVAMSRPGEHALQHASVHLAGVVVELHLQMIGRRCARSAPASGVRCRRRRATAASCAPRSATSRTSPAAPRWPHAAQEQDAAPLATVPTPPPMRMRRATSAGFAWRIAHGEEPKSERGHSEDEIEHQAAAGARG